MKAPGFRLLSPFGFENFSIFVMFKLSEEAENSLMEVFMSSNQDAFLESKKTQFGSFGKFMFFLAAAHLFVLSLLAIFFL